MIFSFYLLYKHKNYIYFFHFGCVRRDKKRKLIKFLTQHSDLIWIPKLVKQFAKIRPWNHMKDVCVAPEAWGGCMSKIKLITLIKVFWIFFTCVHTHITYTHTNTFYVVFEQVSSHFTTDFLQIQWRETLFERLSFVRRKFRSF